MNELALQAMAEVRALGEQAPPGKHIATGDIRRLSARLYRSIEEKRRPGCCPSVRSC